MEKIKVMPYQGKLTTKYSISAMILTSDNYILYGIRSSSFALSHIMKNIKYNLEYFDLIKYLYNSEILKILRNSSIKHKKIKEYILNKKIIGIDYFDKVLIGGHKSINETSIDALIREIKEETNIDFIDIEKIYDLGLVVINDNRFDDYYLNHIFVVVSNLTKRSIVNKFYSNFELQSISFIPFDTINKVLKHYLFYIRKILQI